MNYYQAVNWTMFTPKRHAPGYPVISTWASYDRLLAAAPLYAAALNSQTGA